MQKKLHLTMAMLPFLLTYACNLQSTSGRANMYAEERDTTLSSQTDINRHADVEPLQWVARMKSEDATSADIYFENTTGDKSEDELACLARKWKDNNQSNLKTYQITSWVVNSVVTLSGGADLYNILKTFKDIRLEIGPKPARKQVELDSPYKELDYAVQTIGGEQYQFPSALDSMGGNVGITYKVRNLTQNKDMVIKIVPPNNEEPQQVKKIMAAGGHPNIVEYYGVYDLLGFQCIVMEYLKGSRPTCNFDITLLNETRAVVSRFCDKHGIIMTDDNPQGNALFTSNNNCERIIKLFDFDPNANR